LILTSGCAEKKGVSKRFPRGRKPDKDVIRPASQQPPEDVSTPQRAASTQLVERGLEFIDAKNYELAAVRFQDAINIDPRNGLAYYYLALTDYYMGQNDTALGLLDKAKSLMGHDEKWNERIENLRASILTEEATAQPEPEAI
jgi:tetratricopeptide (TPR) repeat protein